MFDCHVHLIGVTSLFLASKYEDIKPLHHELIAERISHGCFSGQEILDKHFEMLTTLEFDLDTVTTYDILLSVLEPVQKTNVE